MQHGMCGLTDVGVSFHLRPMDGWLRWYARTTRRSKNSTMRSRARRKICTRGPAPAGAYVNAPGLQVCEGERKSALSAAEHGRKELATVAKQVGGRWGASGGQGPAAPALATMNPHLGIPSAQDC